MCIRDRGKIDPTFIASVFTGVLATFGVQTAKNKANGGSAPAGGVSKSDLEKLINAAAQTAPAQTLSLIHISEPTRLGMISYAVFCFFF